jgi:hypothetical protein
VLFNGKHLRQLLLTLSISEQRGKKTMTIHRAVLTVFSALVILCVLISAGLAAPKASLSGTLSTPYIPTITGHLYLPSVANPVAAGPISGWNQQARDTKHVSYTSQVVSAPCIGHGPGKAPLPRVGYLLRRSARRRFNKTCFRRCWGSPSPNLIFFLVFQRLALPLTFFFIPEPLV